MKKIFLLIISLAFGLLAQAQSIAVKSFRALPMDMTASSLEGKRIDQNGDVAALIKVVTSQTGFTFEGGTLGVVDTKQSTGEIWVWVPRASRKITILHQQLGVLRDYRFPVDIESERTYEMVLTTAKVETVIKEEVHQQYLVFQVSPANATLEVNDELWSVDADGTALQFVTFGTYTYRVRAANYTTDAGVVTVDDPDNPKTVQVTLKPDFAEVTLKVEADAEIWVNNEKKGLRTWTGSLGKGTYKIECKQESHETTMISKEITREMNGQTITLPAPTPICGSLNVESTPIGATIFIDGKEVGKTPRSFNEILVGKHEIKLTKEGYAEYKETMVVTKDERKQVKATLSHGKEIQFTCNVPNAQLEIDGQRIGSATGNYKLTYGSHNLKAMAYDYRDYNATISVSESSGHSYHIMMQAIPKAPEGASEGVFSVSATQKVYFAKSNLQYQASSNTWRFAANPWDIIGDANGNISPTYSGWIDLFGWSTVNNPTKSSKTSNEYFGFTDWGSKMGDSWRTLTKDEWGYVFDKRKTASGIRYAKATVNGVSGIILLPDDWSTATYELKKTNKDRANFNNNTISSSTWNSVFAPAGAVFLPAAGSRVGIGVYLEDCRSKYWSASYKDDDHAYCVYFWDYIVPQDDTLRCCGCSVRLVHSVK